MLKISGGEQCLLLSFFCEKCLEVSLRIEASFEWQEVRCKEHTSRHKAIKNRLLQRPDHTQTSKERRKFTRNRHTRTWTLIFIEELLLRSHAYDELVKANKVLLPSNFLSNMFSKPKSSQEENQGLSHPAARCSKFPFLCCSLAWSYVIEKKFAGGWNWHLSCWCNICSGKMIILI